MLVEAVSDLMCEGKEGSGGGSVGPEAMLGRGEGEAVKFCEQETLQNFNGGAE